MPLADFLPQPVDLKIGKGTLQVRALTLEDVSTLVRLHAPDMQEMYAMFSEAVSAGDDRTTVAVIMDLVRRAPGLVANIIAIAVGEDNAAELAQRLPASVQIQVLQKVGELTFDDYGGPGEFLAALTSMVGGLDLRRLQAGPPSLNA